MKVYIVTTGSHPDYTIITVFLNKKKAELLAGYFEDIEIEEFDICDGMKIDKILQQLSLKRKIYFVRMDIDGKNNRRR